MNKRLKTAFAELLLLGSMFSFSSLDAAAQQRETDPAESKTDTTYSKANPVTKSRWFHQMLDESAPYDETTEKCSHKGIIVTQVETNYNDEAALILQKDKWGGAYLEVTRHGNAAAQIIKKTADNSGVDVHFLKPKSDSRWLADVKNPLFHAVWLNSQIIAYSMAWRAEGNQEWVRSEGGIDTYSEIDEADRMVAASDNIFIKSAGNYAMDIDSRNPLVRAHAEIFMRGDTFIMVGAANHKKDGKTIVVDDYSSPDSVGFILLNPFQQGFSYTYLLNEKEARRELEQFYSVKGIHQSMTGKEFFYQSLQTLRDDILTKRLRRHPSFNSASFPGKDILLKNPEYWRAHPEETRQAFVNAVIDATKNITIRKSSDFTTTTTGEHTRIRGTSFTAPAAAGVLADMMVRYPQLTKHDLVAASLIAAEPVREYLDAGGNYKDITTKDNGAGIVYNNRAGFGVLYKKNLDKVAAEMVRLEKAGKAKSSKERAVSSVMTRFGPSNTYENPFYKSYFLDVKENIRALSTSLTMRFENSTAIPLSIKLINPQRGEILLSPTTNPLSIAWAIGHFANETQGRWEIRVGKVNGVAPEIIAAQLTVKGMEKGGLTDEYLKRHRGELPPARDTPRKDLSPVVAYMP